MDWLIACAGGKDLPLNVCAELLCELGHCLGLITDDEEGTILAIQSCLFLRLLSVKCSGGDATKKIITSRLLSEFLEDVWFEHSGSAGER